LQALFSIDKRRQKYYYQISNKYVEI